MYLTTDSVSFSGICHTHLQDHRVWKPATRSLQVQLQFKKFGYVKIRIYSILPVVLYGCETWSLTLREEQRLKVFANRVLRRTFGPKRDEVTGGWRNLHNEELRLFVLFVKYY
jgi:hypothetical protein